MVAHWLDGLRQLNYNFWRTWVHQPLAATKLALLTIAVALRDFVLWVFMGDNYLKDDDNV